MLRTPFGEGLGPFRTPFGEVPAFFEHRWAANSMLVRSMFTATMLTCSAWACTTSFWGLGVGTFGAIRQVFINTVDSAVQTRNVGGSSGT